MSRIGFIGTGHIAAPMVRFLAAKGHDVTVSERNAETAAALAKGVGIRVAPNQQVLDESDIVFLCVRPGVAEKVLEPLVFRAGQQVISAMASVSLAQLKSLCAPAIDIIRTMPVGFLEVGGCPLPAYPDGDLLDALFEPENPVITLPDEAAFNYHSAIATFISGMLDMMSTSAGWLARKTGDALTAEFYTTQLLSGFLNAMPKNNAGQIDRELNALATPGSLSLQMKTDLRSAGIHTHLRAALDRIEAKLENSQ